MLKFIIVLFCFWGSVNAGIIQNFISIRDTLIEPGKENPNDVRPDTLLPEEPDTIPDNTISTDVEQSDEAAEQLYAEAELSPTAGNEGGGKILFSKVGNGIKITGEINGLSPGLHGIHIHENGDCSAPDAESAGGHFNPDQMPHGAPEDNMRHTGDLGNLEADENGVAVLDFTDTKISLEGVNSIVGKSVVIHSGRDDLKTQPAGDSGKRILCGVIKQTDKGE